MHQVDELVESVQPKTRRKTKRSPRGNSAAQLDEGYAEDDFENETFVKPIKNDNALLKSIDPSAQLPQVQRQLVAPHSLVKSSSEANLQDGSPNKQLAYINISSEGYRAGPLGIKKAE